MVIVEIKEVSKSYKIGEEKYFALNNISLSIKKGSFVTILGPSGSGKSTLMHLIGGLDIPTTGEVIINNTNISTLSDKKLAEFRSENIGFVFQSFYLLPRTSTVDNVALPLLYAKNSPSQDKVKKLLASVRLENKLKNKPNELSGGEQQRVAIARALVNNPEIILADEPTGNLDSKRGKEIIDLLLDLQKQGKTIIMVTHDENLAKLADNIIRIKDGEIV